VENPAAASPLAVRAATPEEIPKLAGVLARAFASDPFFAFVTGDAPGREQRMVAGWAGTLRYASARLSDTYTTDDQAGAAIWIPPAYKPPLLDSIRVGPAMARLTGWGRLRAVADAVGELERRRHNHVPEPHYYLSALGVEPGRQGQGIGTALMRPVLDRCDREHIPAYLETATERNVPLYLRHGFEVVEELTLPGAGVHGWLMRRAAG
jgi:GNAT superfamily N-acetyltransferase